MVTSSMDVPAAGVAVAAAAVGAPVGVLDGPVPASAGLLCPSFTRACPPATPGAAGLAAFWPAAGGDAALGSVPMKSGTSGPWSPNPEPHPSAAQAITMGRAVLLVITSLASIVGFASPASVHAADEQRRPV